MPEAPQEHPAEEPPPEEAVSPAPAEPEPLAASDYNPVEPPAFETPPDTPPEPQAWDPPPQQEFSGDAGFTPMVEMAPQEPAPTMIGEVETPMTVVASADSVEETEEGGVLTQEGSGHWSALGENTKTASIASASTGDFSDVTDYANNESPVGPITYSVTIRGLELAETFDRLREALTDSRFNWDADAIMGEVRHGEVTLAGLNPTKASILISRLKYQALEISWTQDVFA